MNKTLTDELREQLTLIERCQPDLLLMHIRERTAFDANLLTKVFELAKERAGALLAAQQPEPRAEVTDFLRDVAGQTPEKPDHWNACGQCERNIDRAQDLLDGLSAHAGGAS